jgi:proteasome assembly chaperone (PAC2) family protein
MAEVTKLNHPWMIAVWPGMGQVALSSGYYLMAKLGMHQIAEFAPHELFDVEHVDVKNGVISMQRLPRSRVFVWNDPPGKRDIVVFLGEAETARGRYPFCRRLIEFATQLGVERVFTFAAMATQMHPEAKARVFAATTDSSQLAGLEQRGVEILGDGQIGGLNGVLLGVASEAGLGGTCLFGEMPDVFAQLPFPKASLAVLKIFAGIAELELDLTEMAEHAEIVEQQLGGLLAKVEEALKQKKESESEDEPSFEEGSLQEPKEEERIRPEDEERIEKLFDQAQLDRSKAYELKSELDRLGVFDLYEDRFLDLFKKTD